MIAVQAMITPLVQNYSVHKLTQAVCVFRQQNKLLQWFIILSLSHTKVNWSAVATMVVRRSPLFLVVRVIFSGDAA